MKKTLVPVFLLLMIAAHAQLNNSWINYGNTYYKFKLAQNGVCRINQPVLASAGLGNISAEQFQLWRNGQQVTLYTSVASGSLSSSDYIEFWGKMNDGIPDKPLYFDPKDQLCDSFSLFSDTAVYFLTANPTTNQNLRYTTSINNTAISNTLTPEPYFMRRVEQPYKQFPNAGYAIDVQGDNVYSGAYDQGEGWTSYNISPLGSDLVTEFDGTNIYTGPGAPSNASFYIAAFGNNVFQRNLRVKIFNAVIIDTPMTTSKNGSFDSGFDTLRKAVSIPLSTLQNASSLLVYTNSTNSTNPAVDQIVVGAVALTYPAAFNFNGAKNFYFELQPSSTQNYLDITNFNTAGAVPVLYDITNGLRYLGDISGVTGEVKFVLPASTAPRRKFMLVSEDATNIMSVTSLTPKTFIDYGNPANQGNYIIISTPALYNDGTGIDYVEKYREYRASLAGGNYKAITVPIDELVDQFGFGIKKHPSSIRDFIRYAAQQFSPQYVLIIGRGVTWWDYAQNNNTLQADELNLVPTFGWPASDILLACQPGQNVPIVPIGRIPAINGTEIGYYYNKIMEYESAEASTNQTVADKGWMKNYIHISGGSDSDETAFFTSYLNGYKNIAQDTLMGANVQTYLKSSTDYVEQLSGAAIQQTISGGAGFIGYFGHGSANTLAFNLNTPQSYHNQGKYPFFNISGCAAGDFYTFDPTRFTGTLCISEAWVLSQECGSIGCLADASFGISNNLNAYNVPFYNEFCRSLYGGTVGTQLQKTLQTLRNSTTGPLDYFTRIHMEEINLDGDPALRIYSSALPDYDIEDQLIRISPSIISAADSNFNISVQWMNLGKAIDDTMRVAIERKLPNNTIQTLYSKEVAATKYIDSVNLTVHINPGTDAGANQIIVILDSGNHITELSESNNTFTKSFQIYATELNPVYPYNYSIVNQQNITFFSSTANPLSGQSQYLMQIDTTALFNSSFMKQYNASGIGGIVQFAPTNITFKDSTVYYWRTTIVPTIPNTPLIWNSFSFVYLPNGGTGFNQSHYYQHLQSAYNNIVLDSNRVFDFTTVPHNIIINTGLYPSYNWDQINVNLDYNQLDYYGCIYNSLQIFVYDPVTLLPWQNQNVTDTTALYGSGELNTLNPPNNTRGFFEFPYGDPFFRKNAVAFLNSVPEGYYVSITNLGTAVNVGSVYANASFISDWKTDPGNNLYDELKSIGFTKIDSFTSNIPFVFFYRKGNNNYTPQQYVGATSADHLSETIPVTATNNSGTIQSPLFGPAKTWQSLHWMGKSVDSGPGDSVQIQVYGIKKDGTQSLLDSLSPPTDSISLTNIAAATYPYLQLKMVSMDTAYLTPDQLDYWRINAAYVPEGAVAPNLLYTMTNLNNSTDTVEQGQKIVFALAFKNVSPVAFDSLQFQFVITDANNVAHIFPIPKGKALQPSTDGYPDDTLVIRDTIDTRMLSGNNTIYVMVNPNNNQPEQYLTNNFIYQNFYVKQDQTNPLLDVTFDGMHIFNGDIVSSKPHILISLQDENLFQTLADTSLISVQVQHSITNQQGNSVVILQPYYFSDSLQFIPANPAAGINTASINFAPSFSDGQYELIVSGKDEAGNPAGSLSYHVAFDIINKPMISNLLNYPNPFTTSTAFVFTLTGSQIPQNMRIQILTITGKVVKEITESELGPIHVGYNITSYKWNGTDTYGQKLANGVYLYRVLTNLNGKSLGKYSGNDANRNEDTDGLSGTDKYFTKGYGKMYLMR